MKVTGKVARTQTIEGTISPSDLRALVKSTFAIPDGATWSFHAYDSERMTGLIQAQLGYPGTPIVQVDETNPLRFRVEWSLPVGEAEQG